jgi:parallel beta-helix repeat protein
MTKQISLIGILLFISHLISFGQGSAYSGPYTPSAPIQWYGISNQTISGLSFTNLGRTGIELWGCSNITIKNCKFSKSAYQAITAENAKNLTIENCVFDSIDGVYITSYVGHSFNTSSGVKFIHNYCKNTCGGPRRHAIQFAGVDGCNGNQINYNSFEQIPGQSYVDDIISCFKSNGVVGDSIEIKGNWLRGGDSSTGSGIMAGDYGGSYIAIRGNIIVNIVATGIGNPGGSHILAENNICYLSSEFAAKYSAGMYITNLTSEISDCSSNTIRNNRVYYAQPGGTLLNYENFGNCGAITGWDTNIVDPTLNASILPEDISGSKAAAPAPGITTESNSIQTEAGKYNIYPNPAVNNLIIETNAEVDNGIIEIYDLKGQKVIGYPLSGKKTEISINILKVGIYIAKLSSTNQLTEAKKIIVGNK